MIDNRRHQGLRKRLVSEIRNKGIKSEAVLNAIGAVPRHLFLNSTFVEKAYQDIALQIGENQTISQPYTVAYQTELLQLSEGFKVLEIGTGSGYQAAVLCEMNVKVCSVERIRKLHQRAKNLLRQLGYYVDLIFGDGYNGYPEKAPFDRILITAAIDTLPLFLLPQLKSGGFIVFPKGGRKEVQEMMRLTKTTDEDYELETFGQFRFVPMLEGKENESRHRNELFK